jgi:rhodanese-related sulfurtransferase
VELIDVREPLEWEAGHIEGARHIPLGQLAGSMDSIDASREVVVMCRSGGRGTSAARQLAAAGLPAVRNLAGGLTRWRTEVDPALRVG